MVIVILRLIVILIASLHSPSSFEEKSHTCTKNYFNLNGNEKVKSLFPRADFEAVKKHVDNYRLMNVNFIKRPVNPDLNSISSSDLFIKYLNKTICWTGPIEKDYQISIHYIGGTSFVPNVNTELFYITLRNDSDYIHELIIGLNCSKNIVRSVINFSESRVIMGFSDLLFTEYHDGFFKIIHPGPSDISDKFHDKTEKIYYLKLLKNGKVRRCIFH